MEPELKAKWVAALRSGTIEQADGVLCDPAGKMCCLGVLREIIEPGARYEDEKTIRLAEGHEAGLTSDQRLDLADMNDGHGPFSGNRQTFAQIADYIEAKL